MLNRLAAPEVAERPGAEQELQGLYEEAMRLEASCGLRMDLPTLTKRSLNRTSALGPPPQFEFWGQQPSLPQMPPLEVVAESPAATLVLRSWESGGSTPPTVRIRIHCATDALLAELETCCAVPRELRPPACAGEPELEIVIRLDAAASDLPPLHGCAVHYAGEEGTGSAAGYSVESMEHLLAFLRTAKVLPIGVSGRLWSSALPKAFKSLFCPFIVSAGRGTLPEEAFRSYAEQNWIYLHAHAEVGPSSRSRRPVPWSTGRPVLQAMAAAAALAVADPESDPWMTTELSRLARESVEYRDWYRGYAADTWDLVLGPADTIDQSPACRAYVSSLRSVASSGDLPSLAAFLAPCGRLYLWIGEEMIACRPPTASRYLHWFQSNCSAEGRVSASYILHQLSLCPCTEYTQQLPNAPPY